MASTAPQLAPDVRDQIDETVEHFNANHADTVLLIARYAAGAAEAVDAEAVSVDTRGVDFEVRLGSGRDATPAAARAEFAAPAETVDEIRGAVFALIAQARALAGEQVPPTSIERELTGNATLPTFVTSVVGVAELTPNLREVVIGGPELAAFPSAGGDEFFYVLVARDGADPLPDGYTMADWMAADEATRPHGAYYTVRRWDPERAEITLWAVLHGHHDGVGGWLGRCGPGDRLAIWGPRHGFWSDGVYVANGSTFADDGRHHLFVTDESGFAAVAALIELLPPIDTATVLAETVDADHAIAFPGTRTNVRWHYRGSEPPGAGAGLLDLVRQLVGGHPSGAIATAFGAGESRQITAIRKFLRHDAGMPATAVSMTGYWRRT